MFPSMTLLSRLMGLGVRPVEAEWMPPTQLDAVRRAKLRRIVWHAYLSVPAYATPLRTALTPWEIETLESPARLPAGVAADRRDTERFRARLDIEPGGWEVVHSRRTRGKKGAAQTVLLDEEALERQREVRGRLLSWGAPLTVRAYESAEFGVIAAACAESDGALHVMADQLWLEVLDDAGQPVPTGQLGRVHVTDFHNRVAPYLRHDLEDRGRLLTRPCRCGRSFPLFELA